MDVVVHIVDEQLQLGLGDAVVVLSLHPTVVKSVDVAAYRGFQCPASFAVGQHSPE